MLFEITSTLSGSRINADVEGRPKHYWSIYQKMIIKGRDFDDIHDLVGVRVLVDEVRDCYASMGMVHALWQPMPGRFKDYIAQPRFGVYQSLHTTVIGPDGKPGGNPALMKQGIPVYTEVYRQAFGAMPSGEKFEALLLMNDIATKLQRGFFLPKGAPDEAAADLRRAYQALASDAEFVADYERITKEKPDFVGAEDVQLVFDKMRAVRPEIRQVLKLSIGG